MSIATLGETGLTEGIKFLYGQVSEVLKRRRERREGGEALAHDPVSLEGSDELLEGSLQQPVISFENLDQVAADLEAVSAVLRGKVEHPTGPANEEVIDAAEAARRALELIYGQRITFKGESRPPSGPVVIGRADATKVAGDLAGIRARLVRGGRLEGTVEADEVTGKATGVDIGTVG